MYSHALKYLQPGRAYQGADPGYMVGSLMLLLLLLSLFLIGVVLLLLLLLLFFSVLGLQWLGVTSANNSSPVTLPSCAMVSFVALVVE